MVDLMALEVSGAGDDGGYPTIDVDSIPSVASLIDDAIGRFGDRIAIEAADGCLTYRQLDHAADALAEHWFDAGLRHGDRVAVMLPNLVACAIVLAAGSRSGLVQVNCNPRYTASELGNQLRDAEPAAVVVGGVAAAAWSALADGFPGVDVVTVGCPGVHGTALKSIGAAVQPRFRRPFLAGGDALFLQYTGGTTGSPKAAILTHRNVVASVLQTEAVYAARLPCGEFTAVTALPLYHIFALVVNLLLGLRRGAYNRIVDAQPIESVVAALCAAPCTLFTGVNTLFAAVLKEPGIARAAWPANHTCVGGGAPIDPSIDANWFRMSGQHIRQGYGLTETTGTVSASPDRGHFDGTVGLPVPSTEVRILGEGDADVPRGARGELVVRGPQVSVGYWRRSDETRLAFTGDGFLRTGDIATQDDLGFIRIIDRCKDLILVSGFNVYPAEIEQVASTLGGVAECACVGVDDEQRGQVPALFIVPAPGSALDDTAVQDHCIRSLAAYKRPRYVHFVATLPRSAVGKILRRELRNLHSKRSSS